MEILSEFLSKFSLVAPFCTGLLRKFETQREFYVALREIALNCALNCELNCVLEIDCIRERLH